MLRALIFGLLIFFISVLLMFTMTCAIFDGMYLLGVMLFFCWLGTLSLFYIVEPEDFKG
jgi:hypothetical protein